MISGIVNTGIEAVLQLVVCGSDGEGHEFEGVVDTGFSGDLTLPTEAIESLDLTWCG